jgi:DNA polymerase-3 subunit delta'
MDFSNLPVYRDIQTSLTDNAKSGRVPHAQFFLGQDGSGNLPLAIAYANELLTGEADMFGGKDDRASRLEHPDIHVVFPMVQSMDKTSESLIPRFREAYKNDPFMTFETWMDLVNDSGKSALISKHESENIIKKLSLKAYEGGKKVMVIWMPEMMNIACANKLLKLIEEPPPGSVLLLVGADFDAMLPTIRSRVQLVKLKPVKDSELVSFLESRVTGLDHEVAQTAVRRAEGNLSQALSIARGDSKDNSLEVQIQDWMRLCYKRSVIEFMKWIDSVAKEGKEYQKQLLSTALEIFRMAFRKNYVTMPVRSDDMLEVFTQKFSPFVNQANATELLEFFDKAYQDIDRNGNARIIFTDLSFKVTKALRNPVSEN